MSAPALAKLRSLARFLVGSPLRKPAATGPERLGPSCAPGQAA